MFRSFLVSLQRRPRCDPRWGAPLIQVRRAREGTRGPIVIQGAERRRYGLALHPDKTRLVPFLRPRHDDPGRSDGPGTFDLLGFTHYWGRSRKGLWGVRRRTAKDRFNRTQKRLRAWCAEHRHDAVEQQQRMLSAQLNGHDAYFGITSNFASIARLRDLVRDIWRKALSRRSHNGQVTWSPMDRLLQRFPLPRARIVHSYVT